MAKKEPLSTTHPALAKEWHPTKNGDITTDEVTYGSHKKVWWICSQSHEWRATIYNRSKNLSGCSYCANQKVGYGNDLETNYPIIAKQWHPTKNKSLKPNMVLPFTNRKVWWLCSNNHEFIKSPAQLINHICPYCSNSKVGYGNDLETNYPRITKQWHPTKNKTLTPDMVLPLSNKKVWWKCPVADDHEWDTAIWNRTSKKTGCPICSGHKIVLSNSIEITHPGIAKQWHPTKNKKISIREIGIGSGKKAWWKCPVADDHEWKAVINTRKKSGCSICVNKKVVKSNCLKTTHPKIAKTFHKTKNGKYTTENIHAGSGILLWWKCPVVDDHEWQAKPLHRVRSGCICCSNHKVVKSNSLGTTHPDLSKEWHKKLNGKLTPYDVTYGTPKKVWWHCTKYKNHVYDTRIVNRTNKDNQTGCSYCAGKKPCYETSIEAKYPAVLEFWDYKKNINKTFSVYGIKYDLKPDLVGVNQGVKIHWKCPVADDHEWQARPSTTIRAYNSDSNSIGCTVCRGFKVVKSNSLKTLCPELSKWWHPTKNGEIKPHKITSGMGYKAWWKCPVADDHEFQAWIGNMAGKGDGCSICSGKIVVKSNCLATTNPELVQQWDYKRNKGVLINSGHNKGDQISPYNITNSNGQKINWKCLNGTDHLWEAIARNRHYGETGCPVCSNAKIVKSNCLATTHPELIKEWCYEKNDKLFIIKNKGTNKIKVSPETIGISNKKVFWQCLIDKSHIYSCTVDNKIRKNSSCPVCKLRNVSREELAIKFELINLFEDVSPEGYRIFGKKKVFAMDMHIEELNLIIEYDGQYWHSGKELKDKRKSKEILKEGFDLIRLRQYPLKKITKNDIIVSKPIDIKKTVNDILIKIIADYNLSRSKIKLLESYIIKENAQNNKKLNNYITLLKRQSRKLKN